VDAAIAAAGDHRVAAARDSFARLGGRAAGLACGLDDRLNSSGLKDRRHSLDVSRAPLAPLPRFRVVQ
jgi:hypothetical protein